VSRNITPVGHPTVDPADWSAVYNEAYETAMQAFASLPPGTQRTLAIEIATYARTVYAAAIEAGKSPWRRTKRCPFPDG
jgi:hypothetical protein